MITASKRGSAKNYSTNSKKIGVRRMNNQGILDSAPLPDWTHHNDDIDSDVACFYSYIKQVEGANGQEFYKVGFDGKRKVWKQCNSIYNTTRSRIDIERIVELETTKKGGE